MPELQWVGGRFVAHRSAPLRICILVIASNNLGIYATHEAYWKLYAKSHPNVDVYFLRQREDAPGTYLDGDTIWSRGREATERTFDKTVAAFRFLFSMSYDYTIRTNLSSVWNFDRLIAFCKTLPRQNVFCGVLGNPGISGAGMILSPDVVLKLTRHSGDIKRGHWDDIDFGKIAEQQGIPSMRAQRGDPHSKKEVDAIWDLHYHYYLKYIEHGVRNVETELEVMRYLIEKIYRV